MPSSAVVLAPDPRISKGQRTLPAIGLYAPADWLDALARQIDMLSAYRTGQLANGKRDYHVIPYMAESHVITAPCKGSPALLSGGCLHSGRFYRTYSYPKIAFRVLACDRAASESHHDAFQLSPTARRAPAAVTSQP